MSVSETTLLQSALVTSPGCHLLADGHCTHSLISLCLFPYLSNQDPTVLAVGVAVRFK